MSDFIREVDEEIRQDQFRQFLGGYGVFILVAVVLVLGGVGAWRGYASYRQGQAEAAGSRYFDALELARDTPAASLSALEALSKDAPSGYRLLARLRAAGEVGKTDPAAGLKAFDAIAADATIDPELQDVARIRAAIIAVDSASPEDLKRRLEPLADGNATFRSIAREMLAVAALKAGDDARAGHWLDAIEADPVAPPDLRQRAGLFLSLVRSGKAAAPTAPPSAAPATPEAAPAVPTLATVPSAEAPAPPGAASATPEAAPAVPALATVPSAEAPATPSAAPTVPAAPEAAPAVPAPAAPPAAEAPATPVSKP